jgi:hypothetical protein
MELLAMLAFSSLSLVIVEVEGDREKVLARGPRCVSLSFFVSFQDILMAVEYEDGGGGDVLEVIRCW